MDSSCLWHHWTKRAIRNHRADTLIRGKLVPLLLPAWCTFRHTSSSADERASIECISCIVGTCHSVTELFPTSWAMKRWLRIECPCCWYFAQSIEILGEKFPPRAWGRNDNRLNHVQLSSTVAQRLNALWAALARDRSGKKVKFDNKPNENIIALPSDIRELAQCLSLSGLEFVRHQWLHSFAGICYLCGLEY